VKLLCAARLRGGANIHRRHLTPEKRREIIATLLKADPTQSNRSIGSSARVDDKTVGAVRSELEATAEIPQLEETTGKDGKKRKRNSKGNAGTSGDKEKITYAKVIDAKTAQNAYKLFDGHLLDALEEVCKRSSFSHAEEYAQATIEKLKEKLGELQPEMAQAAE
jgi:hypothetical protein